MATRKTSSNKTKQQSIEEQTPSTEIVKVEPPPADIMAFFAEHDSDDDVMLLDDGIPVGVDVSPEELTVPRLTLVQLQSRISQEVEAISAGMAINSLTRELVWPVEGVHILDEVPEQLRPFAVDKSVAQVALPFVPIRVFMDRVYFTDGMDLGCRSRAGGIRTVDGFRSPFIGEEQVAAGTDPTICANCPGKDWGADNEAPACAKVINVLGFALNLAADPTDMAQLVDMPIALCCSNTSYGTGRQMAGTIRASGKNPWAFLWQLWTVQERNEKGSYCVWRASRPQAPGSPRGLRVPKPIQELAARAYEMTESRRVAVDHRDGLDEQVDDFEDGDGLDEALEGEEGDAW